MFYWSRLFAVAGISVLALASEPEPGGGFGFSGREDFPIDSGIGQLKSADLDGDGLQDLVVVNNARSKINLLYNRTGQTNTTEAQTEFRRQINELPPDARFKIDSLASEKRISSLAVADFNHDSRPDIAYYGEPRELIVQYNEGNRKWSTLKRFTIDDGTLDAYALVAGDLNSDKRTDLLLLADNHVYLLTQSEDGTLAEPEKIPYIGTVKSIQVLDIQGDGRDDLMLVNWDNLNPFRFRLQNEHGKLGPEIHFTLPPIRSYWADDLDADQKTEIITIAQKSGRAQVSVFRQKEGVELLNDWRIGQFQMVPLLKTTKTRRGTVWADVNHDTRVDLVVSDPESGQLTVFLQGEAGGLGAAQSFPTLTGVSETIAAEWDGDGKNELFVLSNDERQIGLTRMDGDGKLSFPSIINLEGRPLGIAPGFQLGEKSAVAMILDQDGRRELQLRTADGQTSTTKLSEGFKANPSSVTRHDVDQDGQADLVILVPYEKIKILLQGEKNQFTEVDVAAPGGSAEQPWLSRGDVDGDGKEELLLAQRNFLRALVLKKDESKENNNRATWSFQVKDQINGASSSSRIVAAGTVAIKDEKSPALFLLDAERKALSVTRRNTNGVWQIVRNISLPFTDFQSITGLALGGKEVNAVALTGLNTAGWIDLKGEVWELAELDGYETPIKDGFLHDVVSGDLNQDKRRDLVFLETAKGYLDLVTFETPHTLKPANRWQVFEERTFRNRRNDMAEPREAIIVDLTADGKNDLAVLVHDRVLVYPQE